MNTQFFLRHTFGLLLLFLAAQASVKADERTISINVEITQTAVNRFIAGQNFPTPTVSVGATTYTLSIARPESGEFPTVTFANGSATLQFTLKVTTQSGATAYSIPVSLSIAVPTGTLSTSNVTAFLQGFNAFIDAQNLPQEIKNAAKAAYNNLGLTMYPTALLNNANNAVPSYLDIVVNSIGISSQGANNGKLTLGLQVKATGNAPDFLGERRGYTVSTSSGAARRLQLRFKSNVATMVKELLVTRAGTGQVLFNSTSLAVPVPKGGYSNASAIDFWGLFGGTVPCLAKVLFISDFGQYSIEYSFNMTDSNDNWAQMGVINRLP